MNELIILNECENLIEYVHKYLFCSFPKSELSLKINFENSMYGLLENIIRANYNVGNIRNKYQKEALVNISLLDFFIGIIYKNNLIIKKRFLSIVNKLSKIKTMTTGWINEKR